MVDIFFGAKLSTLANHKLSFRFFTNSNTRFECEIDHQNCSITAKTVVVGNSVIIGLMTDMESWFDVNRIV